LNRDNWLFTIIGLLVGFIAGYLMHEVMAPRQPARLAAGAAAVAQAAEGGEGGAAAPAASSGPSMEQIQQLRAQVEKNPNDADAVLLLANLNYDIRNWQRARELYEHYLTLRPATADILTDYGVCLREVGEFKTALAKFDQAVKMSPTHWQSRYNRAVVLAFDLKDFKAARAAVDELRQLQPNNNSVSELATEIERLSKGG